MHSVLPIYCETALSTLGRFPAEPINTLTSFVPVLFGILVVLFLLRRGETNWVAWTLAIMTILTGLGSMAWHAFRTELTLIVDALPGLIYFLIAVFFWAFYLRAWLIGLFLVAAFVTLLILAPPMARLEYRLVIVGVLAIGLLVTTRLRKPNAFPAALAMTASAFVAVIFRSLDLEVCDMIPFGIHFFWHIFLAIAAYAGVRLMVALKAERLPGSD